MTLPFNEKIINDGEINSDNFKYPNFIGFINRSGIPISFGDRLGYTGHGEMPSIQEIFRVYYILKFRNYEYISNLERHITSNEYLNKRREQTIKALKKQRDDLKEEIIYWKKRGFKSFTLEQIDIDIYTFFINCYSSETFFDGVGNIETCMCEQEFYDTEYKNKSNSDIYDFQFKIEYGLYKDRIHADILKNVMIQYLGYHSVERVPRTITTSSFNIYETFYNYLLNDFTIFQLPKMIFDSKQKKYIQQNPNEFFIPDSELRLRDEIQAIKRLVPIKDRYKYYR